MNKIAASLGLVALGATALHAAETSTLNPQQQTKPWSVGASLRGFYDDNIDATADKTDSLGFEIAPTVDFGMAGEQTSFNLGYTFSAKYYDKPRMDRTEHWDYTHSFDAALSHVFSPRVEMLVRDSFVIGQEPDLLRAGDFPFTTPQRIDGNNIRNYGAINFNVGVTELLSFNVGYNNAYFNYEDDTIITDVFGNFVAASTSGLLNRSENRFVLDSQWRLSSQTVGIIGYTYGQILYTGDQPILQTGINTFAMSDSRDSRSHTMYIGAQHVFSPKLSASLNVGAQLYDYYKDPTVDNEWSPYVVGNVRYALQAKTAANAGFSYSRSASDVAGQNGQVVRGTEVALIYGSLTHEIIPHLIGSANATLQHATYDGGGNLDNETYLYLQLGFDLAYQFTPNLSAHLGYNYDDNDSDLAGRSYNRNRVYLGVTAVY